MNKKDGDLFIVDNNVSGWTGLKYLEQWTEISTNFDIATGYFEIGSLLALDGHWQKLEKIRILMGDEVTKRTKKAILEGLLKTSKKNINSNLENEKEDNPFLDGVPAIIEAIAKGQIECRVYDKGKFHAKTFITHAKLDVVGSKALVGSSNFTKPGLTDNIELNVQVQSPSEVTQLQKWYEEFWEEGVDISEDILKVVEPHAKKWIPFDIYAHSLNEFFKNREVSSSYWEENESIIFPKLDQYQKEAYWSLCEISNRLGGAFLCDGVGLGKTYVGLMLLEKMIRKDKKHVVLFAPKGAREGVWDPIIKDLLPDLSGTYFSNLAVFNHTDLNRETLYPDEFKKISEIADVVIVDEAHHFRNKGRHGDPETGEKRSRYYKFRDFIQQGNQNKKLFMLTATPINNKLTDLRNMIELFTNKDESYFSKTLGIHNLRGHFSILEKELKNIHGDASVNFIEDPEIANSFLKGDEIFENLIVQRSRSYVLESQTQESGGSAIFPERQTPQVAEYKFFKTYSALLDKIEIAFNRSSPLFSLAVYCPLDYYTGDKKDIDDYEMKIGRSGNVVSLIRTLFLKRFESSVSAFETSCDRIMQKLLAFQQKHCETVEEKSQLQNWMDRHDKLLDYISTKQHELWGEEDDDEVEPFPSELLDSWEYLDRENYRVADIIQETFNDLDELAVFLEETKKFKPENDDKLNKLIRMLNTKKFVDKKVIIFTEFADTARYIEKELKSKKISGVARIDGGSTGSRFDAVRQFSPYYNNTNSEELKAENKEEIRVLVATDVLSEGLNLQDCTILINYDIHWNPVRLMQRIGRIDRRMSTDIEAKLVADYPDLASDRGKISFYNFLPPDELNRLLRLYTIVTKKTLLISNTMGIEGRQLLTPEDDYDPLREFNAGYEGPTSSTENLHLKLQKMLRDMPGLQEKLDKMPGAIFSGRTKPKKGTKGVFFCFRLPGWDESKKDFLDASGPCRWYLYDISKNIILEDIDDIINSIECKIETPRKISSEPKKLKEIRDDVKKHIKNTYLKKIEAPIGVSSKLVAWMEIG